MKTLCRTLLLIILSPCVCAASFGVNVTQSLYEAEETHNITLEWTFTTNPHRSWTVLMAYCELRTGDMRPGHDSSLLTEFIHVGDELKESVGEQFAGRVQSDREALREGRISLHVSRLRPEDSGWYLCEVRTDHGLGSESCRLNVTAAADHPEPQRPTEAPGPDIIGWIRLSILVVLTTLVLVMALLIIITYVILHLCRVFIKASNNTTTWKTDFLDKFKLDPLIQP